jgi:hypothetical protein
VVVALVTGAVFGAGAGLGGGVVVETGTDGTGAGAGGVVTGAFIGAEAGVTGVVVALETGAVFVDAAEVGEVLEAELVFEGVFGAGRMGVELASD